MVIQSILLYGSESWTLHTALLARLEGFHICAVWRMSWEHKPRREAHGVWTESNSGDVLEEVCLHTMEEYIQRNRNTGDKWIPTNPLFAGCLEGTRLQGYPRHLFWWEQEFDLDLV